MTDTSAKRLASCELIEDESVRIFELLSARAMLEQRGTALTKRARRATLKTHRQITQRLIVLREVIAQLDIALLTYRHNRAIYLKAFKSYKNRR